MPLIIKSGFLVSVMKTTTYLANTSIMQITQSISNRSTNTKPVQSAEKRVKLFALEWLKTKTKQSIFAQIAQSRDRLEQFLIEC